MSGIAIFAFIVLPATIAAGGWIAVLANTAIVRSAVSIPANNPPATPA
ncbi:hypothetical protein [Rhizobium gallicum]|nr:hypothetical protein [Rhizobium gallicum]ULJ73902.1 hypothetical protein L2W42_10330 [Rhizobium gallicum]